MAYRLANPPADAPRWIVDEFRKLEQAWRSGVDRVQLDAQYVEPVKPREGTTAFAAGGAYWNPGGGGAGPYTYTSGTWQALIGGGGGGGGVTDHGALTGLADDDHPQYHNDARGDARYSRMDDILAVQALL